MTFDFFYGAASMFLAYFIMNLSPDFRDLMYEDALVFIIVPTLIGWATTLLVYGIIYVWRI